jgi:hypothetical protein
MLLYKIILTASDEDTLKIAFAARYIYLEKTPQASSPRISPMRDYLPCRLIFEIFIVIASIGIFIEVVLSKYRNSKSI